MITMKGKNLKKSKRKTDQVIRIQKSKKEQRRIKKNLKMTIRRKIETQTRSLFKKRKTKMGKLKARSKKNRNKTSKKAIKDKINTMIRRKKQARRLNGGKIENRRQ